MSEVNIKYKKRLRRKLENLRTQAIAKGMSTLTEQQVSDEVKHQRSGVNQ